MADDNKIEQMKQFLIDRLSVSHDVTTGLLSMPKIDASYLLVDKHSAVLLVDRPFPDWSIEKAYKTLVNDRCINPPGNVGIILYKDGENFFKSDAKWGHKEQRKGRLLEYEHKDIGKLVQLAPEESFAAYVLSAGNMLPGRLQYYQAGSKILNECITQYTMTLVKDGKTTLLGFSEPISGSQPQSFILKHEHEFDESLQMFGSYVVPRNA